MRCCVVRKTHASSRRTFLKTDAALVGTVPVAILQAARAWARDHRRELMAKWRELNG
jgi:hypothetical protein